MALNLAKNLYKWPLYIESKPCLTNAVAWHVLNQVQELSGGVWGIPNKLPIPANYVKVIGQPYAQFDGVAYGLMDNTIDLGPSHTLSCIGSTSGGGALFIPLGNSIISQYPLLIRKSDGYMFYKNSANETVSVQWVGYNTLLHNFSIVRDNQSVSFFVDGVQIGSTQVLASNAGLTVNAVSSSGGVIADGQLCCLRIDSGSTLNLSLSESNGNTVYDTSGNGNNLTLINATLGNSGQLGDFWQYDQTGELEPEALLYGCFKRSDNGALVPLGVDTSGMTGIQLPPFSWSELPYTLLYPIATWADDMDKSNTLNWEASGTPTGREWSYEQLNSVPILRKEPVVESIFVRDSRSNYPVTDILITTGQTGDCLTKTKKWNKESTWNDLLDWDDNENWGE